MQNRQVYFQDWGLRDYAQAWAEQERVLAETVARKVENRRLPETEQVPTSNYLFFVQHPPVFTLGKSGKPEHLLEDEHVLQEQGIQYYKINRGGDITYHGPGQLVGYPILDLDNFKADIHWYMRTLEEAIIQTCTDYGLDAGRIPGMTGVWLDHAEQKNPRKICAMGVKASRWVTMHGFALNVNNDLGHFTYIVPCGLEGKEVTSLAKELGHPVPFEEVSERLRRHLATLFGMELVQDSLSSL
ncbi:lipoyl(octanoyl) transferase LipB [Siphonobacter aquaeclarae]|uniref:Octanoyltransferase n=1 Tax=Siphonobacter aquaeclarae TaxID=563176 RepID=A0A1G9MNC0_9BACT|nr:lipoyl(octanoyl) transferase LipB [Siphonobacter aquaeclarae]SDL75417.1 lipoyl(octanoyl) transferase [Siphonobacter aquaeclarae]